MPGGDVGAEGPSQTVEPVAATRRGPDWIAALAWGGAGLFALVVAGLATVGFQTIAPQWPAISARWQMAIFEAVEAVEGGESPPVVEPLPGVPPPVDSDLSSAPDGAGGSRLVTNPTWLVRPQGDFPTRALRQGIESGRVELTCPVSVSGHIQSCWIVSETPEGAGFGQAALEGVVLARLQPRTVDGVAVDTVISFTTRFEME